MWISKSQWEDVQKRVAHNARRIDYLYDRITQLEHQFDVEVPIIDSRYGAEVLEPLKKTLSLRRVVYALVTKVGLKYRAEEIE